MVTNAGGGYSQWGDLEITRWRSDRTRDPWGTFCYIHEADSDRLWSNTYHPVGGKVEAYSVDFALDRAVFRRTDNGIQTETEVIVSPEDDVEIRRITLINRSVRTRRLNLTSYVELSMAPHNADRQHPAFNKLFIQTEAVPEHQALLAYRRPRGEDEPPIYVAHRFTLEQRRRTKPCNSRPTGADSSAEDGRSRIRWGPSRSSATARVLSWIRSSACARA